MLGVMVWLIDVGDVDGTGVIPDAVWMTLKGDAGLSTKVEGPVRAKLKEHKATRREGKAVKLSEDDGLKILFNSGRRIFRAMKGLHTSAERRQVMKTVVGWWMEDFAVPGTLECKRLAIPEGTVAQVGRPRKKGKAA